MDTELLHGRRKTDMTLTEIVRAEVEKAIIKIRAEEKSKVVASGDYVSPDLKVKVQQEDGTVIYRRAKRTKKEMFEAMQKALPIAAARHPDWPESRIRRVARNMVRRYRV